MPEIVRMIVERANDLWVQATEVWLDGGWAMIAIAVIALLRTCLSVEEFSTSPLSLALATVVTMRSWVKRAVSWLRNSALRWAEVRPSFRP